MNFSLKEELRKSGMVFLKGFIEPTVVTAFNEKVQDVLRTGAFGSHQYFEPHLGNGTPILGRLEFFLELDTLFSTLIYHQELISMLEFFFDARSVLFKEKLNFKLPFSNPYPPHQDAPAYSFFPVKRFLTVLVYLDPFSPENGSISFAKGQHVKGIFPFEKTGALSQSLCDQWDWTSFEGPSGSVIVFDSFVPHKSGPNRSNQSRRALFTTFNPLPEGDHRLHYFALKKKYFPPTTASRPGSEADLFNPFHFANPFL
ncbi:hypothetical protein EBT16_02725 [bacterium]|nr:hypothetical protein [bacterium]